MAIKKTPSEQKKSAKKAVGPRTTAKTTKTPKKAARSTSKPAPLKATKGRSILHALVKLHPPEGKQVLAAGFSLSWAEHAQRDDAVLDAMTKRLTGTADRPAWRTVFAKKKIYTTFKGDCGMSMMEFRMFIAGVLFDLSQGAPPYSFNPDKKDKNNQDFYDRNYTLRVLDAAAEISQNMT